MRTTSFLFIILLFSLISSTKADIFDWIEDQIDDAIEEGEIALAIILIIAIVLTALIVVVVICCICVVCISMCYCIYRMERKNKNSGTYYHEVGEMDIPTLELEEMSTNTNNSINNLL